MDYEKMYKEALERAREYWETDNDNTLDIKAKGTMEYLFPELAESQDEKVREWIYNYFRSCFPTWIHPDITCEEILSWLEKQKVTDEEIIFRPVVGTDIRIAAKQALEKIDIGKKVVLAFNGAYIPVNGKTVEEIDSEYDAWLEKQGQKPAEWHREDEQNLNACIGYIPDEFLIRWLTDIIYVKYDKPAWSEEDEKTINDIMWIIEAYRENGFNETHKQMANNAEKWLKSLKNKTLPQTNGVWSEEDESHINSIIDTLEIDLKQLSKGEDVDEIQSNILWLKSLKPIQKQEWSEEDSRNLSIAIEYVFQHGYLSTVDWLKSIKERVTCKLSEEHIKMLDDIVVFVSGYADKRVVNEWITFLKSLKQRIGG